MQEDEAIAARCFSALARSRRDGALNEIEEEQARAILQTLQGVWTEVEPTNVVREQAGRVLRLHLLRAADALQLAAALVWCQGDPSQHGFFVSISASGMRHVEKDFLFSKDVTPVLSIVASLSVSYRTN